MLLWKHMGIHQTDALQPATRCLTAGDGTGFEYQLYRKTGKNPSSISKKGEMKSASSARPCPQRERDLAKHGEVRIGRREASRVRGLAHQLLCQRVCSFAEVAVMHHLRSRAQKDAGQHAGINQLRSGKKPLQQAANYFRGMRRRTANFCLL